MNFFHVRNFSEGLHALLPEFIFHVGFYTVKFLINAC